MQYDEILKEFLVNELAYDKDITLEKDEWNTAFDYKLSNGEVWSIGEEDEYVSKLIDSAHDNLLYYSPDFLGDLTDLPSVVFRALQKTESEESFDAVYQLVDENVGLPDFFEEAIRLDGLGNIVPTYDGKDYKYKDLFIVRVN